MWWNEHKFEFYLFFGLMILVLVVLFIMILPTMKREQEVKAMPEQEVWVQVVKKEIRRRAAPDGDYKDKIATFETSDGIKIVLKIRYNKVFDSISEGDTGTLTFKGFIDSEKVSDRIFISFEKE